MKTQKAEVNNLNNRWPKVYIQQNDEPYLVYQFEDIPEEAQELYEPRNKTFYNEDSYLVIDTGEQSYVISFLPFEITLGNSYIPWGALDISFRHP